VGPPDPISHLRPVIYNDVPKPPPPSLRHHPYSLSEFDPESERNQSPHELHWKLQRQQLDDLNQNFWLDVRLKSTLRDLTLNIVFRATVGLKRQSKQLLTACHLLPLL